MSNIKYLSDEYNNIIWHRLFDYYAKRYLYELTEGVEFDSLPPAEQDKVVAKAFKASARVIDRQAFFPLPLDFCKSGYIPFECPLAYKDSKGRLVLTTYRSTRSIGMPKKVVVQVDISNGNTNFPDTDIDNPDEWQNCYWLDITDIMSEVGA